MSEIRWSSIGWVTVCHICNRVMCIDGRYHRKDVIKEPEKLQKKLSEGKVDFSLCGNCEEVKNEILQG